MRLLLGGLLLLVLFLAATSWQKHWTSQARADRSAARGSGAAPAGDLADGWSHVIVGRASGSEAYAAPARDAVRPQPLQVGPSPAPAAPAPSPNEWTIAPGQSLSMICKQHYGSARLEVVDAVAKHNGLASPDLVREGQKLDLPPIEALLPKR